MSATNRCGTKRETHDFYPTPSWCVYRLVDHLPGLKQRNTKILEPCAGDGAIIRALGARREMVTAVELREAARTQLEACAQRVHICDFTKWIPGERFDVAITNPPYSHAMEIIEACWPLADRIVMLLRLNFLGSAERHSWISKHTPDVYVLPNRPSFVHGRTDSCEYAWMVWTPNDQRDRGLISVLGLTPRGSHA